MENVYVGWHDVVPTELASYDENTFTQWHDNAELRKYRRQKQ